VLAAYGAWWLLPVVVFVRLLIGGHHPFTTKVAAAQKTK